MQAPSALSRFAFIFLFTSLAFVLAMLWFLHHLPAPPKGKPAGTVHPLAKPPP